MHQQQSLCRNGSGPIWVSLHRSFALDVDTTNADGIGGSPYQSTMALCRTY